MEKPPGMLHDVVRHCGGAVLGLALAAFVAAPAASAQGGSAPGIVGRPAWGAKPADTGLMRPQTPHEIVVHHTALRRQPELTLEQQLRRLQRFSRTAGSVNGRPKAAWGDVPYHFYIDATGRIGEGRDVRYAGDTNTGYNAADRIQIVLEGQFDQEQPTPAQLRSLDRLVIWLAAKHRIPAGKISAHSDHAATECPGQSLRSYLPVLRDKVAKAAQGK